MSRIPLIIMILLFTGMFSFALKAQIHDKVFIVGAIKNAETNESKSVKNVMVFALDSGDNAMRPARTHLHRTQSDSTGFWRMIVDPGIYKIAWVEMNLKQQAIVTNTCILNVTGNRKIKKAPLIILDE